MTARTAAAISSLAAAVAVAGCQGFYQVPVEIPVQSKIDVAAFQRVLVAGFITGGSKSIDPNSETARLLKSQLRSKQDLRVVDADTLPLMDEATKVKASGKTPAPAGTGAAASTTSGPSVLAPPPTSTPAGGIQTEQDLDSYNALFSDADYWKDVGQQYQNPLIVTGTILFTEIEKSGVVTRPQPYTDQQGTEQYRSVREFSDQKGYSITPKFVFIDGHTGAQLYSETYHEEALYPTGQNTPALSSYFELMDKVLPSFLNTLSSQKIKGTRVLLK